jgi:heme exporter protein CcmD
MPKYAEFVFAAYGLFAFVMGIYAIMLLRRTRAVRRALAALDRVGKPSA